MTLGMMYPWATKEYILWEMTWAQVIMYLNEGLEQKYPKPKGHQDMTKLSDMNYDELKAKRDEIRTQEELRAKYGKID